MEDNKEKTSDQKPANFILEWISDNLRYILLFGCMVLIVVLAVVIAGVILGGSGQNQNGSLDVVTQSEDTSEDSEDDSDSVEISSESEETSEESVETDETSEESVETDEMEETSESSSDTSGEGSQGQQSSDESTSSGQSSGANTGSGQSSSGSSGSTGSSGSGGSGSSGSSSDSTQQTSVLSEASEAIVNAVTSYFNALAASDADAAAAVVESLSDEDRQTIASGLFAEGYHNIVVYTYPGESDSEWVAFARYYYTYSGFTTAVPALTQFYLVTGQDGAILIASETTLEVKADYMSSVLSLDDVTLLISEVQAEYDAVITANPALAAYIASVS